jgi:hypothetical protein
MFSLPISGQNVDSFSDYGSGFDTSSGGIDDVLGTRHLDTSGIKESSKREIYLHYFLDLEEVLRKTLDNSFFLDGQTQLVIKIKSTGTIYNAVIHSNVRKELIVNAQKAVKALNANPFPTEFDEKRIQLTISYMKNNTDIKFKRL